MNAHSVYVGCTKPAAVSRFGRLAIGAKVVNVVEQIDGGDKGETDIE